MLKLVSHPHTHEPADEQMPDFPDESRRQIDFEKLIAAAKRQKYAFAITVAGCLALAMLYIVSAVPKYTASAELLIDSRKNQDSLRAGSGGIADLNIDTSAIDSQVEILKSERVADLVIDALNLTQDQEFLNSSTSVVSATIGAVRSIFNIRDWFKAENLTDPETEYKTRRQTIKLLNDNLVVKRVQRTYVLSLNYTLPNAQKAAQIANAFADAYFTEQLQSKYDVTKRASGWLQERIEELRSKSITADLAVQKFKADNGLVTADGKLVNESQLTDVNTQLVTSRNETARAEARYNQITSMVNNKQIDGAVTDSLGSPVINDLRVKLLKASKTQSELSARLGPNHYQVISLGGEMTQYQRLIFEELQRIAESYKSELDVARAREKSLNDSMADLVGQSAVANKILVQLRELQRESDTYRDLYQAFLQRYQEALQRLSFPDSEARVITPATRSIVPTAPRSGLILAGALVFGCLLGAGAGALREYRDRVFRTGRQVRDELGLEYLGMLPSIHSAPTIEPPTNPDGRVIQIKDSIMRHAIDAPLSNFAETLRAMKVSVDITVGVKKPKIIGIVSALPSEGKSTVSKNFASMLAHLGVKTILIDGDLRNPGLTRACAGKATAGLVEVLRGDRKVTDVVLLEPDTGLFVLPAYVRKRLHNTSELLSSPSMRQLLDTLGETFDYIVVDLPPLGPVIDVRAAAAQFDAFLFVVEWGRTARHVVRTVLEGDSILHDKCAGVIFNKVSMDKINLYENHGSKEYYYSRYTNYYRDK